MHFMVQALASAGSLDGPNQSTVLILRAMVLIHIHPLLLLLVTG